MYRYGVAILLLCLATAASRAGSELELLRKYQSDNKTAAAKLKQDADRLLSQKSVAERDGQALRKLLGQLQEDTFLPRDERTGLIRKIEDRLRECKGPADKMPALAVADPKIKVKQAVLAAPGLVTLNAGPMATIVPDGGTRVLGGFSSAADTRSEYGVPGSGGTPYLGRLSRNVGTSRASGSINFSASVRIISMEEEEARFLGR